MVKNPPANAEATGDMGSILGWEDPLEKGTATHSSILPGNSMDRGAWWATVHEVAESDRTEHVSPSHAPLSPCCPFFCMSLFMLVLHFSPNSLIQHGTKGHCSYLMILH